MGWLGARGLLALITACLVVAPLHAHSDLAARLIELNLELDHRLAAQPDDAPLYLERGELHRRERRWILALSDFHRARELDSDLEGIDLSRGLTLLAAGRPELAVAALDRHLELAPSSVSARLARARAGVALGRIDAALADYEELSHAVSSPALFLERARVLSAVGSWRAALAGLDQGITALGSGAATVLQREAIRIESDLGMVSAALAALDRLMTDLPHDAELLRWRAELLLRAPSAGAGSSAAASLRAALAELSARPAHRRRTPALVRLERETRTRLDGLGLDLEVGPAVDLVEARIDTERTPRTAAPRTAAPRLAATHRIRDLEASRAGTAARLIRGPYLQSATSNSVVVRWRTDLPTPSSLHFGSAPDRLFREVATSEARTEHAVVVDGLIPATRYYYSVTTEAAILAGGDQEHFFETAPLTATFRPTRVWVVGDSGTADARALAVRDGYERFRGERRSDLWLMLGDNAYPDGTDEEYQRAVFELYPEQLRTTPLWPTLGNHDGRSADSQTGTGVYYDIFSLPAGGVAGGVPSGTEAYYSFDFGTLHFVCLDSHDSDRSPEGAMLTWLRDDLMATDAEWIVAFWHHPPYSKGSHDSDTETNLVEMRENALPILEDYGVDLVLAGHSHSYERSMLLDGHYGASSTLESSMVLDAGDGSEESDGAYRKRSDGSGAERGAVYVVAGSSGLTSGGALDHKAMFVGLDELGSVVLDLDQRATLRVRFVRESGVVEDLFTIDKEDQIEAGGCQGGETTLCLRARERFRLEATWSVADGPRNPAHAVRLTRDTGFFWFFERNNLELVAKVLDGCAINGHLWLFVAGLTDLDVRLMVTDTSSGAQRLLRNRAGRPWPAALDVEAFSCGAATQRAPR